MMREKGLVLITGIMFLTIVLVACLAMMNNLNLFVYGQNDLIVNNKNFYELEQQRIALENRLLDTEYYANELDKLLLDFDAYDLSNLKSASDESMFVNRYVQKEKDFHYQIEYLGKKYFKPKEVDENGAWIIRISIWRPNKLTYRIESLLAIFPNSLIDDLSASQNVSDKRSVNRRIAWFSR